LNLITENKTLWPIRLQVFLSHSGIASRRASAAIIQAGRVKVNGKTITEPGIKVQENDTICLDNEALVLEQTMHYLILNKPPGYLCSSYDPQGRHLAGELLPKTIKERLYNVGRLDYLSSGMVFFTNDGVFAARISHPSSEIEKEYVINSTVPIPDKTIDAFLSGIEIDGELYKALRIQRLGVKSLRIVLIEGKNREIRKVFSHFRLHPSMLCRIRIGAVELGNLPESQCRPLTIEEFTSLMTGKKNDNSN